MNFHAPFESPFYFQDLTIATEVTVMVTDMVTDMADMVDIMDMVDMVDMVDTVDMVDMDMVEGNSLFAITTFN